MILLSSLTDYRHTNIFVQKNKLIKCIFQIKQLRRKQLKQKVVEIPDYILRDELKKAIKLLDHTNDLISSRQQNQLPFFKL